jgi:phosphoadenosine phosphosulfate reductase
VTATELISPAPTVETATASGAVRWAVETFGRDLTLLCSGQDAVLIDVALAVDPGIEVAFIHTGYHFNETIETVLRIAERYRPRLRVVAPWRHLPGGSKPGFCCSDHKVEQLEVALEGRRAWLSGLRWSDSPDRSEAAMVETDRRGLTKFNPLIAWSDDEVAAYERANDIIVNPLRDRGYPSIGCRPCTTPVEQGADRRAGRWAGQDRTECGIHW